MIIVKMVGTLLKDDFVMNCLSFKPKGKILNKENCYSEGFFQALNAKILSDFRQGFVAPPIKIDVCASLMADFRVLYLTLILKLLIQVSSSSNTILT